MNNITHYYLNWKLKNQDKYFNLVLDKNTKYNISLDEFIAGHENSTKYNITLDLSNFKKAKFISLLSGKELLKANYLVFKNLNSDVCTPKILSIIFKQIYTVYETFKKFKINKLYICDTLINNETKNPTAIIMFKTSDNQYSVCPMSFVYLLFFTKAYKDILVVSE